MPTTIDGTNGVSQVQNGVVSLPKMDVGATPSRVRLGTGLGYGSTNTAICRFTNILENVGSDITYADSATLGASFTINKSGIYAMSISWCCTAAFDAGFSVDSSQLTTGLPIITANNRLCYGAAPANGVACPSWIGYLPAGSVVRPHASVATPLYGTPSIMGMSISRVV